MEARGGEGKEAHKGEGERGKGAESTDIIKPDLFIFPQDQEGRRKMMCDALF